MRLLRVGQPLPAPQTLGPARGIVCLRAGERPSETTNRPIERPLRASLAQKTPTHPRACSVPPGNQPPAQSFLRGDGRRLSSGFSSPDRIVARSDKLPLAQLLP